MNNYIITSGFTGNVGFSLYPNVSGIVFGYPGYRIYRQSRTCRIVKVFLDKRTLIFLPKNSLNINSTMFFFFHLLTGIILGLLISDFLEDGRWLIPCAIGAVLPDLIDKPIGYILFPTTIGDGRIYAHTLLAAILILVLGLVIYKIIKDPGVLAVGVGILSHQILDLMWRQPLNWYFPVLGPFKGKVTQDYLFILLFRDVNQPFEQILALSLAAILIAVICRNKIPVIINRYQYIIPTIATICALLLCILSGIIIGRGIMKHSFSLLGWSRPEELILGGIVIALAAGMVWRWQSKASRELDKNQVTVR